MKILLAQAMGLCFGVRDALAVMRQLPAPQDITVMGQLVHNPHVQSEIARRGFHLDDEPTAIPRTDHALITAHGISDARRAELLAAGKELIDTTCPLVRKAHAAALSLARSGHAVIIIGKRDHVEVRGLLGDLDPALCTTVESMSEVVTYAWQQIGIIAQTTTLAAEAARIVVLIRSRNPQAEIVHIDTICQPTKDRQLALETLLHEITRLVVIGGKNSNNTKQLVTTAEAAKIPAYHIESPAEVNPNWFSRHDVVGLTAGTSTLPGTINATHARLLAIAQHFGTAA